MTTFQYPSLDTAKPGMPIRLLHLQPGQFSDPIRIELLNTQVPVEDKNKIYRLVEANTSNWDSYEALSYAWGSTENQKPIFVIDAADNANMIEVTENLDIALRHLRRPAESRTLWIDAVCIDQGKDKERDQQVAMMWNVYARAAQVLVWLGPEENDSDHAMGLLQYLGQRVERDFSNDTLRLTELGRDDPELANLDVPLPYGERDCRSLLHLYNRPWFERLWVRQEVS